jgi:peroxiredoxin
MRKFAVICLILVFYASAIVPLVAQAPGRPRADRPRIVQGDLQEGKPAPDFALKTLDGKETVKLSSLQGKPVVLIFGSCTCPPFVSSTEKTDKLYQTYKDKAHFYLVYVREAHPTDGRAIPGNDFQVRSPQSNEERHKVAQDFAEKLKVSIPILVDSIDDQVEKTYACWPNRMYILDAAGTIVDKGSAGPDGVNGSAKRAPQILEKLLVKKK